MIVWAKQDLDKLTSSVEDLAKQVEHVKWVLSGKVNSRSTFYVDQNHLCEIERPQSPSVRRNGTAPRNKHDFESGDKLQLGSATVSSGEALQVIAIISRIRAIRRSFLNPRQAADPAWDIVLGLYEAYLAKASLTVKQVCCISGVPPTTALRWIESLERNSFIERTDDRIDKRRTYITLTQPTIDRLTRILDEIGEVLREI